MANGTSPAPASFAQWLPSLVAALVGLLGIFAGPVQAFIAAHPTLAAVLAAIGAIVAHLLPSPTAQQ